MSTKMDEDDWAHTLGVFRACLPRRGRKAEDDRRFFEALHFFTVENVRWRALPDRFGHWNSVWKRFDRLSKAGVFEAFFDTLASMSSTAHLIQMFELHRRARSCVSGWSKGGQEGQALGRSRGGFTTKIHAKSDASGDIIAFDLTGGEAFDGRHFEILLDLGPDIQPRAVICDKGYASKANRETPQERAASPQSFPTRPTKRTSQRSSHAPSTRPVRASSRASDGLSASSASPSAAKRPNKISDQSSPSPPDSA